jgi:hypothetical protein
MEKMVEKLGFSQKLGVSQNPALLRGQKFKDMALEKTLFPWELQVGPKNYLLHPCFIL